MVYTRLHKTRPNQTKPNQTKPNQTKPNQTKPNQTKPNQTTTQAFFDKVDLLTLPSYDRMEKEGHVASLKKVIEKDLPDLLQPIKSAAAADPRDKYDNFFFFIQINDSEDCLNGLNRLSIPFPPLSSLAFSPSHLHSHRKKTQVVQDKYYNTMANQLAGKDGKQGAIGMSHTPPYIPPLLFSSTSYYQNNLQVRWCRMRGGRI